jgi:DNA-binding CsgD family transcriptional regulator
VFFLGVFAYVASRFFLEFADIGFEGAPRRLVISLSAAVLAVSPLAFIKGGPVFISILPSLAGLIVFLFAMLYSQLRLVFAYGRIRDRLGRIGIPTILAYNIVCIAGCTLDSIVSGQQLAAGAWPFGVLVQPLLYLAWNILSLAWALAYEGSGTIGNSASLEPDPVAARRFGITDRELELARLLAKGAANKEIAAVLGLSPNTVRNHVHNIFEKTGARNRVELVRALCDRGGVAS